jgi:hypothetical protein
VTVAKTNVCLLARARRPFVSRRIMPKIFSTCLVTEQPIDTCIEIDEVTFARLLTLP